MQFKYFQLMIDVANYTALFKKNCLSENIIKLKFLKKKYEMLLMKDILYCRKNLIFVLSKISEIKCRL